MKTIPSRLNDERLRFYLIGKDSKIPMQRRWNNDINYPYNHPALLTHLKQDGNYGVCCGIGNLVVIDFDEIGFFNKMGHRLPPTLTTRTAEKRLYHMYYFLEGEMFKKIGIDKFFHTNTDREVLDTYTLKEISEKQKKLKQIMFLSWLEDNGMYMNRVCDIQAHKAGVVGPGSTIGRRYYTVVNDRPITTITKELLQDVFGVDPEKKNTKEYEIAACPEKERFTREGLIKIGIPQTNHVNYQCPFHQMHGQGNLSVMDNGALYCFHCEGHWNTLEEFIIDHEAFKVNNK